MTHRVIFPGDDYWTNPPPPKEHTMTNPIAADNRRATALVCHFGRQNMEGVNAVLAETIEERRITPLIVALLELHANVIPVLLTPDGMACFTAAVYVLANDEGLSADARQAVQLILSHNDQNDQEFNHVLRAAADAGQVTELIVSLLSLFCTLMPILYSELGLQTLERSILDWAAREDATE